MGLLLLQLKQPEPARLALETGLEQAPDDADLLYAMIYLHGSQGQRNQALPYVVRMQQVAPDDPRLVQAKQQLGLGTIKIP